MNSKWWPELPRHSGRGLWLRRPTQSTPIPLRPPENLRDAVAQRSLLSKVDRLTSEISRLFQALRVHVAYDYDRCPSRRQDSEQASPTGPAPATYIVEPVVT